MSWTTSPQAINEAPVDPNGKPAFIAKSYAHSNGLYWGSPETTKAVESAFYQCEIHPGIGPALRRMKITTDDLLVLPDPTCDLLLKEFVEFWERADRMKARGFSLKRGLFLHGKPGGGKTSAVQRMSHHMTKTMGGIVVMVSEPQVTAACLQLYRSIEPTRPVICVYEDIDALIAMYGEAGILALLDGELQIANVVNVATCNYPELLDPRVKNRPGRFDRIAHVAMPLPEARRAYLQQKAPELDAERIERWVAVSEGWSIAHLREFVVATLVLEEDDEAVIARLTEMHEEPPSSEYHDRDRHMGFSPRNSFARIEGARRFR